jgi:hypothetical protein
MQDYTGKFRRWISEPIDPHVISLFRIVYGLFMAYEMIDYIRIDLIRNMFVLPKINFHYDFFRWLSPLPEIWMNVLLYLLLACSIAITLGIFFKWSCRILAIGYAYIFLIDKSIYNNHIYLFILLAVLLSLTDADKSFSIIRKTSWFKVPRWQQLILQFQIVIVYFYGGIAKLNHDWLIRCQPVQTLIAQIPPGHLLAPLLKNEFGIYLFTYGGFLLDFGAPLLLWYKPIRKWSLIPIILFHAFNSTIFTDIGIFPYVMVVSLVLFFEPGEIPFLRTWLNGRKDNQGMKNNSKVLTASSWRYAHVFLLSYFVFQLLFPLRGFFLPNDMDWTTIGNRFSWRMKVDTRQVKEMKFIVFDPVKHDSLDVDVPTFINTMQMLNLSMDPRSIADFAVLLKKTVAEQGLGHAEVYSRIIESYNGRKPQYFVNPYADLSMVEYQPLKKLPWVYPVSNE